MAWVRATGLREPIIIEEPDGLDMKMPPDSLTPDQVAELCGTYDLFYYSFALQIVVVELRLWLLIGRDRIVEAMEVSTQAERQMTLQEWSEYFGTPELERKRILNVRA
jgi:F-box and leucine-rich repeat protein 10/11